MFDRWLLLHDKTPIYAVLFGTVAANLLPGDPVWLGVIGPPSSAKTEILNSISLLPHCGAGRQPDGRRIVVRYAEAASATKEHKGGLLRQLGDFGIIKPEGFRLNPVDAPRDPRRGAGRVAGNL